MKRCFSLLEFDHEWPLPGADDREAVADWARALLDYLRGWDANELPGGVHLKCIRAEAEPCAVDHVRHPREEARARIRRHLGEGGG